MNTENVIETLRDECHVRCGDWSLGGLNNEAYTQVYSVVTRLRFEVLFSRSRGDWS